MSPYVTTKTTTTGHMSAAPVYRLGSALRGAPPRDARNGCARAVTPVPQRLPPPHRRSTPTNPRKPRKNRQGPRWHAECSEPPRPGDDDERANRNDHPYPYD